MHLLLAECSKMSFMDVSHHEAHGHSEYLVYNLQYGSAHGMPSAAVICLACFLDSLADGHTLNTRKAYVVRCAQLTSPRCEAQNAVRLHGMK